MKEGWEYKKLGEVCEIVTGKLNANAMVENGEYPFFTCDSTPYKIDKYAFDTEAILISGNGSLVGHVNYYNGKFNAYQRTYVLYNFTNFEIPYLLFFLKGYLRPYIKKNFKGGCIPYITLPILQSFQIPLPPLSTQQSIVAELDEINNLLNLKKKELETYDKLAQSLFYEMFGDPVDNEKGWEVKKLGEVCPVVVDGVHSKPNYTSEGKPFVSVVNINKGKLNLTDCKFVSEEDFLLMTKKNKAEKGDILYSKVGATYGIPALVDSDVDFALYVSVCLIKPNHKHINSIFLVEMMRSPFIKYQADRRIRGIGVPDLHLNQIRAFNVILPPLSLQQTFAARIEAIEKQKANVKAAIEKLETLLASRMQFWFE